jgi:hypothetical protein
MTQSSEDETISCRAGQADEGRTRTATLPTQSIAGGFNFAAGAAALASLGAAAGAPGAGPAGSSGAGGGNNTGNLSLGLKRFGLKSKAVRVTSAGGGPGPSAAPAGQDDANPTSRAVDAGQGSTPAATTGVPGRGLPEAQDSLGVAHSPELLEAGRDAASRKRRPQLDVAQSPPRVVPAVLVVQAEGSKRRQSPDVSLSAALGGSAAAKHAGASPSAPAAFHAALSAGAAALMGTGGEANGAARGHGGLGRAVESGSGASLTLHAQLQPGQHPMARARPGASDSHQAAAAAVADLGSGRAGAGAGTAQRQVATDENAVPTAAAASVAVAKEAAAPPAPLGSRSARDEPREPLR